MPLTFTQQLLAGIPGLLGALLCVAYAVQYSRHETRRLVRLIPFGAAFGGAIVAIVLADILADFLLEFRLPTAQPRQLAGAERILVASLAHEVAKLVPLALAIRYLAPTPRQVIIMGAAVGSGYGTFSAMAIVELWTAEHGATDLTQLVALACTFVLLHTLSTALAAWSFVTAWKVDYSRHTWHLAIPVAQLASGVLLWTTTLSMASRFEWVALAAGLGLAGALLWASKYYYWHVARHFPKVAERGQFLLRLIPRNHKPIIVVTVIAVLIGWAYRNLDQDVLHFFTNSMRGDFVVGLMILALLGATEGGAFLLLRLRQFVSLRQRLYDDTREILESLAAPPVHVQTRDLVAHGKLFDATRLALASPLDHVDTNPDEQRRRLELLLGRLRLRMAEDSQWLSDQQTDHLIEAMHHLADYIERSPETARLADRRRHILTSWLEMLNPVWAKTPMERGTAITDADPGQGPETASALPKPPIEDQN